MEELKISIAILLVIQAVQFGVCIVLIHRISNLESDRICQFRIQKNQPPIEFEEVETLGNPSRGGWGSTGKR